MTAIPVTPADLSLLASLASLAASPAGGAPPLLPWETVDPSAFALLVRRHGFSPYACHLLGERGLLDSCPPLLAEALRRDLKATTVVNLSLLSETRRITGGLASRGIVAVPLKGASLIASVYPLPGLRPMDDVDLLVRRGDLATVRETIEGTGWRLPPGSSAEAFEGYHFHLPFVRRGTPFRIELHWRLADDESIGEGAMEEIWRRIPAPEAGGVPSLDPAAALVYQAVHLAKHGFMNALLARDPALRGLFLDPVTGNRLIWLLDLHLLMSRGGPALAAEALPLAARWGVLPPLHDALAFREHLFGPLPGWGWPPDRPVGMASWPKRAILSRLAHGLARRSPRAIGAVERLARMDHRLELRPARALDLLDPLFPDAPTLAAWRKTHGPLALPFLRAGRLVTGSYRVARRGWQLLRAVARSHPPGDHR